MKFDMEKLEQLQDDMNELHSKCSDITYFINKEYKEQVKLSKNQDEGLWRKLSWNSIMDNPFYEELVFLMGEDSDFYLHSDGLHVVGKSPDYEDGCLNENTFIIPYEWLELEGDDLYRELTIYVSQHVASMTAKYYEDKERIEKSELEKAKELIKKLNSEEIKQLLNENN